MLEFIQLIKQRYQSVLQELDKKSPYYFDYQQRVEQLLYGEAFIRKGELITEYPNFPLQIAVIGPTQVGKSSIVNLLLGDASAGVSPLAGYTVHPHGYCLGVPVDDCDGMQHYFGRFQCLNEHMLSRNRYDCYSLTESRAATRLLPECICWDTPDFDSIDAADYREGVIRTIALADVVVLVVSKEKYADQTVWEMMKTIATFQQPTLVCLNKLNEDHAAELCHSLQQKWLQYRPDPLPEIVPLLFQKSGFAPVWPAAFNHALLKLVKKVSHGKHYLYQQQWLNHYWPQWLEPVMAEHQAQQQWQTLVDQAIKEALKVYQRDYLEHPHHYETFQAALLNMLNLLEIPGIARAIGKTRRVMTWPMRKLFNLGARGGKANPGQEVLVLNQIGEHLLIGLADKLLEKSETAAEPAAWWKDIAASLRQARASILYDYDLAIKRYHSDFQQDVEAVAHKLYNKLQEQPVVLNSLRATRTSTDVTAILVALHTGGIGIQDLFITPLMLSITSLLAESAVGSYMNRVAAELKQHQLHTIKDQLFEHRLQQRLYQLPQQGRSALRFNISEALCRQAESALKEKKHGLRVL